MIKKAFLFLGLFAILIFFAYWHLNDGFFVSQIKSQDPVASRWKVVDPSKDTIQHLLNQPFYYLGKGSQCYVFASEDKQIVLKFFRQSRYRLPIIIQYFTFPKFLKEIQQQKLKIKEHKKKALFQSCKIAYEELREETGLLYLHLNPTKHLQRQLIIYDKLKRSHLINIDDYAFVIQKRGEQIFPYLSTLLNKGKKKEAKEALESLVYLLFTRLEKGIIDHDAVIHKNSGFRNNQAIFLDVGGFEKKRCLDPHREIEESLNILHLWLKKQSRELSDYLETVLKRWQCIS